MKVYCDDCKYLKAFGDGVYTLCTYPKNYKDTPYCIEPVYAKPEKDNKDNKCSYFKSKLFKKRKYRK